MAPNLAESQHAMIYDMIDSGTLFAAQMIDAVDCSKRSIKSIRSNLRYFDTTKAPPNGSGRRRSITPPMLQALQQRLLEKPGLCLNEMALFI
jgi:hypothetical protein